MIVAFASQKGGVGKTTATLTAWWALKPDCLAVDLDVQGNFTFTASDGSSEYTIADVLNKSVDCATAIEHTANGDLVASSPLLMNLNISAERLRESLTAVSKNYPLILLDTPPAVNNITFNALTAADVIIIPIQADIYAIEGLRQMLTFIKKVQTTTNPSLRIGGLLVSRYSGRANVKKKLFELASKQASAMGLHVFKSIIRESAIISESELTKQNIFTLAPRVPIVQDLKAFVEELKEICFNGKTTKCP